MGGREGGWLAGWSRVWQASDGWQEGGQAEAASSARSHPLPHAALTLTPQKGTCTWTPACTRSQASATTCTWICCARPTAREPRRARHSCAASRSTCRRPTVSAVLRGRASARACNALWACWRCAAPRVQRPASAEQRPPPPARPSPRWSDTEVSWQPLVADEAASPPFDFPKVSPLVRGKQHRWVWGPAGLGPALALLPRWPRWPPARRRQRGACAGPRLRAAALPPLLRCRYVWGACSTRPTNAHNSVCKFDLADGSVATWHEAGTLVGEPLFVPAPGGSAGACTTRRGGAVSAAWRLLPQGLHPASPHHDACSLLPLPLPPHLNLQRTRAWCLWLPSRRTAPPAWWCSTAGRCRRWRAPACPGNSPPAFTAPGCLRQRERASLPPVSHTRTEQVAG